MSAIDNKNDEIVKRKSGRYPWRSNDDQYHDPSWSARIEGLRKSGVSESEIAKLLGMTTAQFGDIFIVRRNDGLH